MTEYWRSRLSAGERDVYDRILPAIAAGSGDVNVPTGTVSAERLSELFSCVLRDHPECYAVHNSFGVMRMWKNWNLQFRYWYTSKQIGAVEAAVAGAKAKILAFRGTSVEQIRQVLRMLILECDYGVDPKDPARNQNISSVFYQHVAQCSGFSAAFQYAMDLLGIWCMQVTGEVVSQQIPGGRGPHSWNIVRLDGNYYHVDATMMLGANLSKKEPLWYYSVGCSDKDFLSRGYHWDRSAAPTCTARHSAFSDDPPAALPQMPQQKASCQMPPTQSGVARRTAQPQSTPAAAEVPNGIVFTRLFDARKYLSQALDRREKSCQFALEIPQYPVEKLQKMVVNTFRELATEKNITATMQIVSHGKQHSLTIVYG